LSKGSLPIDFMDSTYTIRIHKLTTPSFDNNIKCYAPTAKVTQKFTYEEQNNIHQIKGLT
jgi:hypothetical protein